MKHIKQEDGNCQLVCMQHMYCDDDDNTWKNSQHKRPDSGASWNNNSSGKA